MISSSIVCIMLLEGGPRICPFVLYCRRVWPIFLNQGWIGYCGPRWEDRCGMSWNSKELIMGKIIICFQVQHWNTYNVKCNVITILCALHLIPGAEHHVYMQLGHSCFIFSTVLFDTNHKSKEAFVVLCYGHILWEEVPAQKKQDLGVI